MFDLEPRASNADYALAVDPPDISVEGPMTTNREFRLLPGQSDLWSFTWSFLLESITTLALSFPFPNF